MAIHPLISYVKLFYTVLTIQHVAVIPCKLPAGTPPIGADPTLFSSAGSYIASTTAVTALATVLKAYLNNTSSIDRYEVWSNQGRADFVWVWGDDLAIAGTSATAAVLTGQLTLTYRTLGGNGLKLQQMEGINAANQRVALKATGATLGAVISAYIMGGTNWVMGRDGTFPAAPIWATTKLNDALRHKRNLA